MRVRHMRIVFAQHAPIGKTNICKEKKKKKYEYTKKNRTFNMHSRYAGKHGGNIPVYFVFFSVGYTTTAVRKTYPSRF